jgi:ubiquitin carboxyl-terminal hydrolase 5/13
MLNELMLTGIPELAAKHALVNTGNASSEVAINWYFEHMEDPSLHQPLMKVKKVEDSKYTEENVGKVMEFGFSREQAIFGLSNTVTKECKS